jgi:hypothetical protein
MSKNRIDGFEGLRGHFLRAGYLVKYVAFVECQMNSSCNKRQYSTYKELVIILFFVIQLASSYEKSTSFITAVTNLFLLRYTCQSLNW